MKRIWAFHYRFLGRRNPLHMLDKIKSLRLR